MFFFSFSRNDSIQDSLNRFFDLEALGIRDDPSFHRKDQALEIFKESVDFKSDRFVIQFPLRNPIFNLLIIIQ